ncbi:MAG: glycosyltransferase [Muribaculaceae bacterium]|nr:glycosyltransferase [Muribaculaceae bacterium]
MKILLVNTVAVGGSIPAYMRAIVDEAHHRGHDIAVAKGRRADMPGVANFNIGSPFHTAVHGLATRLLDRHGLAGKRATERFADAIDSYDPDVVHLHNIHGYYLHYPTLMERLRSSRRRVLWSLHDSWAYTGHCSFYLWREGKCSRWQHGCGECPLKHLYPGSVFADRSRRNLIDKAEAFHRPHDLTLLPVSDWLAGELRRSILGDIDTAVVKLDVDTDVFSPLDTPRVPRVLGVAANWNPLKGLDFFAKLREQLPAEVEIRLIGKISGAIPEGINNISAISSRHELAVQYSQATVTVSASYAENYPQAIREALACGSPVVCRNSGGALEDISVPGAPVWAADSDADLIAAVKEALASAAGPCRRGGNEVSGLRAQARNLALSLYGHKPNLRRLFDIYESRAAAKC